MLFDCGGRKAAARVNDHVDREFADCGKVTRIARNNPRFVPAGTIGPAGQDPSLSDRPCASEIACEPENQED